jgi:hypothetical protein
VWGKAVAFSRLAPECAVRSDRPFAASLYSDKGKFYSDLSAARNVNMSECALNQNSLRLTPISAAIAADGRTAVRISTVDCHRPLDRVAQYRTASRLIIDALACRIEAQEARQRRGAGSLQGMPAR